MKTKFLGGQWPPAGGHDTWSPLLFTCQPGWSLELDIRLVESPNQTTQGCWPEWLVGWEDSIGSYKLPEIKTLFDVSHNLVYFIGAYSFLYANRNSGG